MVTLSEFDFAKAYKDRFWIKVSEPNLNGCRLTNYVLSSKGGYGQFEVCVDGHSIARNYGITYPNIALIRDGKRWT